MAIWKIFHAICGKNVIGYMCVIRFVSSEFVMVAKDSKGFISTIDKKAAVIHIQATKIFVSCLYCLHSMQVLVCPFSIKSVLKISVFV